MAKESKGQKRTVKRVMHEYKHGELKRSSGGRGGKVKSRKQAIAIALSEAGQSKSDSASEKRASYRKTKAKERSGKTAAGRRGEARTPARKASRGGSRRSAR